MSSGQSNLETPGYDCRFSFPSRRRRLAGFCSLAFATLTLTYVAVSLALNVARFGKVRQVLEAIGDVGLALRSFAAIFSHQVRSV
jgi:hypothetical protein